MVGKAFIGILSILHGSPTVSLIPVPGRWIHAEFGGKRLKKLTVVCSFTIVSARKIK